MVQLTKHDNGSGKGLALNRQQTIIWTNGADAYMRLSAPLR